MDEKDEKLVEMREKRKKRDTQRKIGNRKGEKEYEWEGKER